jgi:hypothetical protein
VSRSAVQLRNAGWRYVDFTGGRIFIFTGGRIFIRISFVRVDGRLVRGPAKSAA